MPDDKPAEDKRPESVEPTPDQRIDSLEAELSDIRAELRTCHDMLDGAGVQHDENMHKIGDGELPNLRLAARLQRFILSQMGCPLKRNR